MNFNAFKQKYEHKKVEEQPNQVPAQPVVSVCVMTYQHKPYIEQCLDGILMQETDFPIEILLGEDASTDGTREICLDYAKKHPDKIRLFLHHRENNIKIGGRPTGRFNFLYNLYSCRGKYIALCEGDDYWTDPKKLQKQVEFMEGNEEYSLCFHAAKYIFEKDNNSNYIQRINKEFENKIRLEVRDVIKGGAGLITTNSMVFQTKWIKNLPKWLYNAPVGDYPLTIWLATKGYTKYMDIPMSVYRRDAQGSWSSNLNKKKEIQTRLGVMKMLLKASFCEKDIKLRYVVKKITQISYRLLKLYFV